MGEIDTLLLQRLIRASTFKDFNIDALAAISMSKTSFIPTLIDNVTIISPYPVKSTDSFIYFNIPGGTGEADLPQALGVTGPLVFKCGANATSLNVVPFTGDTIDFSGPILMSPGDFLILLPPGPADSSKNWLSICLSFQLHGQPLGDTTPTEGNILQAINGVWVTHALAFGRMSMQDNATATVIAVVSTPVLIAGTMVAGSLKNFTFTGATNQLNYTGIPTRRFYISVHGNYTLASANVKIAISVFVNGVALDRSEVSSKMATANGLQAIGTGVNVSLKTNDIVQIFIENESNTSSITVEDLCVEVFEIGT